MQPQSQTSPRFRRRTRLALWLVASGACDFKAAAKALRIHPSTLSHAAYSPEGRAYIAKIEREARELALSTILAIQFALPPRVDA